MKTATPKAPVRNPHYVESSPDDVAYYSYGINPDGSLYLIEAPLVKDLPKLERSDAPRFMFKNGQWVEIPKYAPPIQTPSATSHEPHITAL
jgi:hypothetical protein